MLYRYIEEYAQFWFVFRKPYSGVWLYMDVWLISKSVSCFGTLVELYVCSILVRISEAVFRCMAVYGCVAHIKIGFVFRDPCGRVCMLNSDSDFGRLVGVYVCYIGI